METVYDRNGVLITVGARVADPDGGGTVTGISDQDGDTNSYGEIVGISPRVTVTYDNGDVEHWLASWNATGPWDDSRTDYTCDDVTLATVTLNTDDARFVADMLDTLAGLDEGEHTDYDRLMTIVARINAALKDHGAVMSEQWRNHYDSWKLAPGNTVYVNEDGEPVDQDALDAQAEAAAEDKAERQREDAMFDREDWR